MPSPRSDLKGDEILAREIAEFIASRAFRFTHHECRAWALTDFGVWAGLGGYHPQLTLREDQEGRSEPVLPPQS